MPQMLTNELSLNPKCSVLVKGYIHLWENSVKKSCVNKVHGNVMSL